MKSLIGTACSCLLLVVASGASADPQTDEANRQRQMANMQAEAARNDRMSADRALAQQQSTADASRAANNANSSSSTSTGSSGGSSGLGASGGSSDRGPQSVVDSYSFVIQVRETPEEMLARLAQQAAQGDTAAQYNLARIYYTGFNQAPRDDARSREYFGMAAASGHAPSQAIYGYFLSEGLGGERDVAGSLRWIRAAAEAGDSFGQAQYGMSLVTSDPGQAVRFLTPAADAGEVTAQAMLGTLYAIGEGVERDDGLAVRYLKAASDQGEAGSTGQLAGMYLTGRGGSEAEGYVLLRQAAEAGDPESQRNYGLLLVQGNVVSKDEAAGAAMVRRAAHAGNAAAQTLLGHLYNEGLGVPQADADAIYWWTLAAEGGDEEAIGVMADVRAGGNELGRPPTEGVGPLAGDGGAPPTRPARAAAASPGPDPSCAATTSAVRGELTLSDPKLSDDSFYDCQAVQTSAGTAYRAVMRSDAFDAYLSAGTGDCAGTLALSDDDGAGGTDAALGFTGDGQIWFVRANSLEANATGAYTLEIGEVAQAAMLGVGQTTQGQLSRSDTALSDGSFYDCHSVQTTAGAAYQVVMRSGDFDTYLSVGTGQCAGTASVNDDDSAGGTDSSLSFTGDGQVWFVRANSLEANATGAYTVELREGSRAKK